MKKITDYAELVKAQHALNKTIAPVENGASMTGSYTSGKQFIRDGVLCTALTSIAAGTAWSSLTLDTDYEVADDVSTQIAAVNSALSNTNTALSNEVATRAKLGGHNLLPYPYTNGTKTEEGITWTPQADGSVLVNGTATADSYFRFVYDEAIPNLKVGGSYTFSISGSNSVELIVAYLDSSSVEHTLGVVTSEATYTIPNDYVKARLVAKVYSGVAISNATIYPMIRLATDANSDYEPYSMTNQELTPIAQAVSNRNLLDNPWFTVNQRGTSSFSSGGYPADRWGASRVSGNYTNNGISFAFDESSSTFGYIWQRIEDTSKLAGKVVTFSVLVEGEIHSLTGIFPAKGGTALNTSFSVGADNMGMTVEFNSYMTYAWVTIRNFTTNSHTVKAAKLELGSVSTLAQDTAPNYATELLKCQRYFVRLEGSIGTGYFKNTTECSCLCPIPVPMRANPSLTMNGNIGVGTEDGLFGILTGVTVWGEKPVSMIGLTGVGVTTTAGYFCRLFANSGDSLDVSADL